MRYVKARINGGRCRAPRSRRRLRRRAGGLEGEREGKGGERGRDESGRFGGTAGEEGIEM